MRMKLAALATVATISLGGCSTTSVATFQQQLASLIAADTASIQWGCGFLPTAATLAGIVATIIPGALPIEQVAAQVAAQICTAVAPLKGNPGALSGRLGAAGLPTVNGVVIHGRFE